ncbi:hypothetical protein [Burkholderia gladioli]|uniref:hypothetical protein n=1 Tax=Burkholderia gladioli TaxID=28095 RepID=UPI00163F8507|nr:hypothetical protein [Burkholderia gladioli]MBJ9677919.1 hypothetical protein [Burkholderia gladioli]
MQTDIQATNYCSHAIDDLREAAKNWRRDPMMQGASRRVMTIVEMLQHAVKFMLPNCAQLVGDGPIKETFLDLFRLPYPLVAFEAPWIKEGEGERELNGFAQSKSTRRIALCWELDDAFRPFPDMQMEVCSGINAVSQAFPEGGVFVLPVYYVDDLRAWQLGAGGSFIPRDFRIGEDFEQLSGSRIAEDALRAVGRAYDGAYRFRAEPFVVVPELFSGLVSRAAGDADRALATVQLDARDEVTMAVQACSVLNCANVETIDFSPSRAMNAKRAAKGKPPFFTYKLLQLTANRPAKGEPSGGTHASPRTHLRRGHLRRLEDRVVWVRAAMVNAQSPAGVVAKDYLIR